MEQMLDIDTYFDDDGLYGGAPPEDLCMASNDSIHVIHPNLPTPEELDALIAQEMYLMPHEERKKVLDDVHGVGELEVEDPDWIAGCLAELDAHLQAIKHETIYAVAEAMSRSYVSSQSFRLMFLRADRYNPKDAAERLVRFLELKKKLFGVEKLCKDITMEDLDENDIDTLKTGCVQVSPLTDMSGRRIFICLKKLAEFKAQENYTRALFYLSMSMVESLESQKRGIVAVYYLLDTPNMQSHNSSISVSIPIHFNATHACSNCTSNATSIGTEVKTVDTKMRVRFRSHLGTHTGCQDALSTFGIPRDALPVTREGELLTDQHMVWFQKREQLEAERAFKRNGLTADWMEEVNTNNYGVVIMPPDVLFGRGKMIVDHPGNAQFRLLIDYYMEKYEMSNIQEKTCIAEIIIKFIRNKTGRFLRKVGDNWVEVDHETARNKVAHAFRNRRRLYK